MTHFVAVSPGSPIAASNPTATAPSSGGNVTVYRVDEGGNITLIGPVALLNLFTGFAVPASVPIIVQPVIPSHVHFHAGKVPTVSGFWFVRQYPGLPAGEHAIWGSLGTV